MLPCNWKAQVKRVYLSSRSCSKTHFTMTSNLHPKMPPDYVPLVGNKVAVRKKKVMDFNTIWDGKDDEGYLNKTWTMMKHMVPMTLAVVAADVILLNRTGLLMTARRALYWGVPILGGGVTYTTTVAAVSSIRKKDGRLNHGIAGAAVGSVVGAANKSVANGLLTGVLVGGFGIIYKSSKMEGWVPFPDPPVQAVGYPISYKMDYSVMADRPGNWVRSLPSDDCK